MARGRRKKLAAIAVLEGNPGKRPIEAACVEGLGSLFVPEHLNDDARACVEVVRASMPERIYCALDSFTLAAFAMAWSVHKRAARELARADFRFVVDGSKGGRTQNPWLRIQNQQAALMASLGTKLGLDPHARQALALPAHKPPSKFEGLLGREANASSHLSRKN
jgi:P27 family predicted phage terminase small subunit